MLRHTFFALLGTISLAACAAEPSPAAAAGRAADDRPEPIQCLSCLPLESCVPYCLSSRSIWIPAFAGMTIQ
jgi:hypothetical protein